MTAKEFYKNVREIAGLPTEQEAHGWSRAVCCALGMRLYGGEAKDFASQLPMELKEAVMAVSDRDVKWDLSEFMAYTQKESGGNPQHAEKATRAVFHVIKKAITRGEISDIESMLPKDIKAFFIAS